MTSTTSPDTEQDAVTRRYDRIARFYDLIDKPMDLLGVGRRHKRHRRVTRSGKARNLLQNVVI